ncbi:MAG: hypothetical protein ACLQU2_27195 [Candidatus Binataceae bacterium]
MQEDDAHGAGVRKFAFPQELGLTKAIGSVPFIAFGAFMLWAGGSLARGPTNPLGLSGPNRSLDSYVFLGGGLLAMAFGVHWAWSFLKFKDYVVVITADTIAYARPRLGQRRSPLPLTEVTGLRYRPLPARLELLGPNAHAVFSVESQVHGFAELLDIAVARVPTASRRLALPRTIRTRVTRNDIVIVVLCAVLLSLGYAYIFYQMLLAVAVVATMYAAGRFFGLLAVTVTGDSVVLLKGYRRTAVPLSRVREVRVGMVRERGSAAPLTGLILTDGSELNVSPQSCDPFEVFEAVQSAMEHPRVKPS